MTDEEKKAQEIQEQAEREAKEKAAEESKKKIETKELPAGTEKDSDVKSPLEEARALDKSIKASSVEIKKLLEKHEKVLADVAVAGKGFAGQASVKTLTDDEKWAEDAKKRYAGTGMDPTTEMKEVTYS